MGIDLGTSEDDVAARALYESAGFTNREGGPAGPRMLYYERDLLGARATRQAWERSVTSENTAAGRCGGST